MKWRIEKLRQRSENLSAEDMQAFDKALHRAVPKRDKQDLILMRGCYKAARPFDLDGIATTFGPNGLSLFADVTLDMMLPYAANWHSVDLGRNAMLVRLEFESGNRRLKQNVVRTGNKSCILLKRLVLVAWFLLKDRYYCPLHRYARIG